MSTRKLQAAALIVSVAFLSPQGVAQDPESLTSLLEERASQPRTLANEQLFDVVDGEIQRSTGFTNAAQAMDFDGDDDIDLHDYTALQICLSFSGPEILVPPACDIFDDDGDGDIDAADTKVFMVMFTGTLSGLLVEAGSLLPDNPSPEGYYSGQPDDVANNALHGIAVQSGYSQDDFWYEWSVNSVPTGSGDVVIQNRSFAASAFSVLPPSKIGQYVFDLKVTNVVTLEFGSDSVSLVLAECISDSTCDDGNWCNGGEVCTGGDCTASEPRCQEEMEHCNEELDSCFFANCPDTFELTLSTDTITGTDCGDEFQAGLIFNAATGTNVPSLQTGDWVDGGDGDDLMSVQLNFGFPTTIAATVSDVEMIEITDFGTQPTTISGTNLAGVDHIASVNGTNTNVLTVNNLASIANLSVSSQSTSTTLVFQSLATTTTSDTITLTLDGVVQASFQDAIQLTTGTTNGFETLNIDARGDPSSISDISMNGTTLTNVNLSGDAPFIHVASLDSTVSTINAAATTGGTYLTQANTAVLDYLGGSGNDTLILGATYGATDFLDGGPGIDTLSGTTSVFGGTSVMQDNVTNFEILRVSDQHTTAIDVTHFGNIGEFVLDSGSNGGSITGAGDGFKLSCGVRGTNPSGIGALAVSVAGNATTDMATYTLNDCNQHGSITFTGAETLNLVSKIDLDGSAANGGVNTLAAGLAMTDTAASERLIITGNEALTINGAITANVIDASDFDHPFIMSSTTAVNGVTVFGGGGNDTLYGSATADIIDCGAGNDTVDPEDGNDIVTLGAGIDTVKFETGDQIGAPSSIAFINITDFEKNEDIFDALNGSLSIASGSTAAAGTAAINFEGICTYNAADDALEERIAAAEAGINASGSASVRQIAIFENRTNSYLFVSDGADGLTEGDVLFQLTGVVGLSNSTTTAGNLTIQ